MSTLKTVGIGGILGIGAGVLFGRFFPVKSEASDEKSLNNLEVLFFPDRGYPCLDHFSSLSICTLREECSRLHDESSSLGKVIRLLTSANRSIDIAIFIFTSEILRDVIEKLVTLKKMRVRIIVDKDNSDLNESVIPFLRNIGVPVRVNSQSSYLMHHKFAVIDNHTVLSGSFNWTSQASVGNRENLLVVKKNKDVASLYTKEFDDLWNIC